ncbi:hypothetical protein BT09F24_13320 [Escherichia coli]
MKKNFQSDKSLMAPLNYENASRLKKIRNCNSYHFKEPEEISDSSDHSRGASGSVSKDDAN